MQLNECIVFVYSNEYMMNLCLSRDSIILTFSEDPEILFSALSKFGLIAIN